MGVDPEEPTGGELFDPFAKRFGRQEPLYSRPERLELRLCGWRCDESFND